MRLKKWLQDLEESNTTSSVGGTSADCCTPKTNGLKDLKVQKRKKKLKPLTSQVNPLSI